MVLIEHKVNDVAYFIPWDMGKKAPFAEGIGFMTLEQTKNWLKSTRPFDAPFFRSWWSNIESHGSSHGNKRATPEAIFSQGKTTPEEAFEMYGPGNSEPVAEASKPKRKRAKKTASKPQEEPTQESEE